MKLITPGIRFLAVFAFSASALHAAVITPLFSTDLGSITSSTTTIGGDRTIDAALNGVGLSGSGTSGDILAETHASAQGNSDNHYLSDTFGDVLPATPSEVLTFDLGGSFNVANIYLWAYNRVEFARGIRTFDIAFDTGSGFGTAVSAASLGIIDFAAGDTSASSSVQTRTFSTVQSNVEAIRFSNITNYGQDRIAIAEIRFGGTPVPEPSVALLGGMGALLLLRRSRN